MTIKNKMGMTQTTTTTMSGTAMNPLGKQHLINQCPRGFAQITDGDLSGQFLNGN